MPPLPPDDIAAVVRATATIHAALAGQRILVTGATGFFGRWLLESLLAIAASRHGTSAAPQIYALSRNPARFLSQNPHFAGSSHLTWIEGDVTTLSASQLPFPAIDSVIHLATESEKSASPDSVQKVIVDGTRRVLALAEAAGATRFLFTSSGAVAPSGQRSVPARSYPGAAEKLKAERLCLAAPAVGPLIARCYTFAGPGTPLDGKFALGNFVRDALAGRVIEVAGDGTAVRSYLYGSDLAAWLLTILVRGTPGEVYGVGSERAIAIGELAQLVDREAGGAGVVIRGKPSAAPPDTYLPDTAATREALDVRETIGISEAIRKTLAWSRQLQR